jgi:hypothetical protein
MCDGRLSSIEKTLWSVATKVPKIVAQRAGEMFPALKEIAVSVLCLRPQEGIL